MNKYIFVDTTFGFSRYKEVLCEPENFEQEKKRLESFQWFHNPELTEIPEFIPEKQTKFGNVNITTNPIAGLEKKYVDEGFKDVLREIKKNSGEGCTIEV